MSGEQQFVNGQIQDNIAAESIISSKLKRGTTATSTAGANNQENQVQSSQINLGKISCVCQPCGRVAGCAPRSHENWIPFLHFPFHGKRHNITGRIRCHQLQYAEQLSAILFAEFCRIQSHLCSSTSSPGSRITTSNSKIRTIPQHYYFPWHFHGRGISGAESATITISMCPSPFNTIIVVINGPLNDTI